MTTSSSPASQSVCVQPAAGRPQCPQCMLHCVLGCLHDINPFSILYAKFCLPGAKLPADRP
eukprot:1157322-Pelagomonas_calceolata.AAC.3